MDVIESVKNIWVEMRVQNHALNVSMRQSLISIHGKRRHVQGICWSQKDMETL